MKMPRSIRNKKQWAQAIKRLEVLMDKNPKLFTLESDILSMEAHFIAEYEKRRGFVFDRPTAIEAIKFTMENRDLDRNDMLRYFTSLGAISKALAGKRRLTLNTIIKLHEGLDISLESLINCKKHRTV